jgi:hypothetical protein
VLTPECLDDGILAALADGTIDPTTRAVALPHLAGCPRCRGAVASVVRALADPAVAREIEVVQGGGRRRFYRIALPLAAAALLLLLVWPRQADDGGPPHRAPPADSSAPFPIAPIGVVANATTLEWTAVAGADRYRVTLSDASGRVLYDAQLADTVLALPDSILLSSGQSYVWMVEARTGFDRWSMSRLVEFSIGGGTSP